MCDSSKIFENLGKNVQNLKIFEKEQRHVCDYHMHEIPRIYPVILCQIGAKFGPNCPFA